MAGPTRLRRAPADTRSSRGAKCARGPMCGNAAMRASPDDDRRGGGREGPEGGGTRPRARSARARARGRAARVCVQKEAERGRQRRGSSVEGALRRREQQNRRRRRYDGGERREEGRDQAPRQLLFVPVVEDEVVRQVREAGPVRVAELLRRSSRPCRCDATSRGGSRSVDEPPRGDRRAATPSTSQRASRTQRHGAPEEVRADSGEVVPERVGDRLVRRVAAERGLRDQRVEDDDCGERKGKSVGSRGTNGSRLLRNASNATLASATRRSTSFHAWIAVSACPWSPRP